MRQPSAASASLVRLSVSSGTRRADLGVPAGIPVVEIVPELARELGVLDAAHASQGFRLVAGGGGVLDPDLSLAAQGVTDGTVLSLETVDPTNDKVYDDVVEAVADVVETQFAPWTPQHGAGTATGAAAVFLLCAAWALFTSRDSGLLVAGVAGLVALLLVGTAAVLTSRRQSGGALTMVAVSLVWAAVSGSATMTRVPLWGEGMLPVGVTVALVALLGAVVVADHRLLIGSGVALGVVAATVGVVSGPLEVQLVTVSAVVYVVAVVAGNVLPWLGLGSTRLSTHPPRTEAEIAADVPGVDRSQVRAQVARGHDVMVAVGVATGGAALLTTPELVASGLPGTGLVAAGAIATLLRTRHSRTRTTVLLAMCTGILALALGAVVAAQAHPGWRPLLAVVLGGTASVVVTTAVLAPRARVRLGRVADAADGVVLVALLPLAAATVGIL
ncbi:MAG: EsaB/YukD family protein [Dermatophilaceae bacterium]